MEPCRIDPHQCVVSEIIKDGNWTEKCVEECSWTSCNHGRTCALKRPLEVEMTALMATPAVSTELAFRLRVLGNAYFSINAAPDAASAAEFGRLFKDPLTMPCPPWQSASDSLDGATDGATPRLMGPSTRSALAWYQRFGFTGVGESDQADHIGFLLIFAGVLLEKDAELETLQRYAHDHLNWIPAYCERLAAAARTPFYRELAEETGLAVLNFIG